MARVDWISEETGVNKNSVAGIVTMFDEGATIPFIARYRKERTGGLDETIIKSIKERIDYYIALEKRRETVLASILEQGKLTDELKKKIEECRDKQLLEDIYLPYKPKKRTRASIAREKGLEKLAQFMLTAAPGLDKMKIVEPFVVAEKGVTSYDDALGGAKDIIAEMVSENVQLRTAARELYKREAVVTAKAKKEFREQKTKFENYYDYSANLFKEPSHRVLAIRRGVNEGVLSHSIDADVFPLTVKAADAYIKSKGNPFAQDIRDAIDDSYKRLVSPSIENEVWNIKLEEAEREAVKVFAQNLENLFLSAPAGQKVILGLDPGFRTGCKAAVIAANGAFLEYFTIFPHEPHNKKEEAEKIIHALIVKHKVEIIAIGNGTASRETDLFVREMIKKNSLNVIPVVVSEAGASVYSASDVAKEEFPDLDLTVRGAISIARRVQDPLSELVKIEPWSIGVGQYQHDIEGRELKSSLDLTVESCVNRVGVDVNTASAYLLAYISGLNLSTAKKIVKYRVTNGFFKNRNDLLKVSSLVEKAYEQCAGFLRIRSGSNPLDNSAIHPESYHIVESIARDLQVKTDALIGNDELIKKIDVKKYTNRDAGAETLKDIVAELAKPGLDPRKRFEYASFSSDINAISDLAVDMVLEGVVTNVTNFGAFVDIGVHQDGLIHISNLADRFVKNPLEVVSPGDKVTVKVIGIDEKLKRISLKKITVQ